MSTTKSTFLPASADSLARIHTAEAVGFMVLAMRGEIPGIKPGERLRAAEHIIERGHGKAVQAVISVPARAAVAAKLAAMTDDELLEIARRGSTQQKGDPMREGNGAGPIQEGDEESPKASSQGPTQLRIGKQDIVDGEFTDLYDPTA